jgi:hypothetical protein
VSVADRVARVRGKVASFRRLTADDRWMLVRAIVLLLGVRVALLGLGVRRTHAGLARALRSTRDSRRSGSLVQVTSTVRVMEMAARNVPGGSACLPRSLALWYLLRRQHIDAAWTWGARRTAAGFEAHAWVEWAGAVVGEPAQETAGYMPMPRLAANAGHDV